MIVSQAGSFEKRRVSAVFRTRPDWLEAGDDQKATAALTEHRKKVQAFVKAQAPASEEPAADVQEFIKPAL